MQSSIVFCGGGSLGHLAPSVAVAQEVHASLPNTSITFLCNGKEEINFVQRYGFAAKHIPAAKFPRGLSLRWITFPLIFPISIFVAYTTLSRLRPNVVFSKGGYVSVPIALVASWKKIPLVLHESDTVSGLGTKALQKYAAVICKGIDNDDDSRSVVTGNPVRKEITQGSREHALKITGFTGDKPVLLIIGGSQGALSINTIIAKNLDALLPHVDIIHLTGKGKSMTDHRPGYYAQETADEELAHFYALADIILTRAGMGVLSEIAQIHKPAIVVPLAGVAHDHQVKNAQWIEKHDAGIFITQEELPATLLPTITMLLEDESRRKMLTNNLAECLPTDAAHKIEEILHRYL